MHFALCIPFPFHPKWGERDWNIANLNPHRGKMYFMGPVMDPIFKKVANSWSQASAWPFRVHTTGWQHGVPRPPQMPFPSAVPCAPDSRVASRKTLPRAFLKHPFDTASTSSKKKAPQKLLFPIFFIPFE